MRPSLHRSWAAAAVIASLGLAASAVRADDVPFFQSNGVAARLVQFAWFNHNGAYFDLEGFSNTSLASANSTVAAPKLGQVAGPGQMLLLHFPGLSGQEDIIESVPDDPSGAYSPIMHLVNMVWKSGVTPVAVTSYQDAVTYNHMGLLAAYDSGAVLNGPVVWENTDLKGQGGNLPSTLLQGVQEVAFKPKTSSQMGVVALGAFPAYYNGGVVYFTDLDHSNGQVPDMSGNLVQKTPVARISLSSVGANSVANFYAVDGQDPVVDSIPGVAGYSPLWQFSVVSRAPGFTTLLTSQQAILSAQASGLVTIQSAGDNAVYDLPLHSANNVQITSSGTTAGTKQGPGQVSGGGSKQGGTVSPTSPTQQKNPGQVSPAPPTQQKPGQVSGGGTQQTPGQVSGGGQQGSVSPVTQQKPGQVSPTPPTQQKPGQVSGGGTQQGQVSGGGQQSPGTVGGGGTQTPSPVGGGTGTPGTVTGAGDTSGGGSGSPSFIRRLP